MKGTKIGSYIIDEKIGEGGMGVVYSATHDRMKRRAVIKMLRKHLAENPQMVKRFENEATAAASIGHPGIVQVFDVGQHVDGSLYIIMELLKGESLQDRLNRIGRLPVGLAVSVIRQAAGALAAAHNVGIVHRDLKPDNMFIVPDPEVTGGERVKLLDFGIAKLSHDGADGVQTKTGAMMGTPHYMSPEQCQGAGTVDHRTDLYALGCILFQLVTGRTPFVGSGFGDFVVAHMTQTPPPLRSLAPHAPEGLENIVDALLAKDPAQRFGSAEALVNALGQLKVDAKPMLGSDIIDSTERMRLESIMSEAGAALPVSLSGPQSGADSVAPPQTTMGLSAGETAGEQRGPQAGYGASLVTTSAPSQKRSSAIWIALGVLSILAIGGVSYGVMNRQNPDAPLDPAIAAAGGEEQPAGEESSAAAPAPTDAAPVVAADASVAAASIQGTEPQAPEPKKQGDSKAERARARAVAKAARVKAEKDLAAEMLALEKFNAQLREAKRLAAEDAVEKRAADKRAAAAKREADRAAAAKREEERRAANQAVVQEPEPLPNDDPKTIRAMIKTAKVGLDRTAKRCGEKHNVRQKNLTVRIDVLKSGHIKDVKVLPPSLGAMARCIINAVKREQFPPLRRTHTFRIPTQS